MSDGRRAVAENVRLAIERLSPLSGIEFGLNRESVEWASKVAGLVGELGSFLGECVVASAGGSWQWSDEFGVWCVQLPGNTLVFPFAKVDKLFLNGLEGGDPILSF
jgi:hypothetical protein